MGRFLRLLAVRLALAGALLAFLPGLASRAFAQAGVNVEEITFVGNRRYGEETLRLALRTKEGQRLDRAALQEDVNSLYEFFDSVELEEEQTATGVKLRFVVTENPLVASVSYAGLDRLAETDVSENVETRAGRPLAAYRLENDARRIERFARQQGYHFVEVETVVTDVGDTKAVQFVVREGPQVSVDAIVFEGNAGLRREDLLDHMATRESGFLGLGGSDYVEDTVRLDLLSLRSYYRYEGWLDARVDLLEPQFSDDREDVRLTIAVTEGPVYTVNSVRIEGGENYPGGVDALNELVRSAPGARRRQRAISDTISALETAYREEGYFAVRVLADEKLRPGETSVDLVFTIEEQSKVRVRRLDIVGNTVTQDKVILRETSLVPGGVLNQNEIEKSVNRLKSLRFFNGVAARVKEPLEGEDPGERDVVFEVLDGARTGQLRFAVGASSDLGVIGSITLTKRNFDWKDWPERFGDIFTGRAFTGAGQTFTLELSPGSDYSSYRVAFTEPWLFDRPISFGWDVFYSKFSRFDYDANRQGIDFSLGRRWTYPGKKLDTVLGVTGTTRIESQQVDNIDREASSTAFLAERRLTLLSERLALRVDRIDNSADPTTGWWAEGGTELGFAGDVQLWRNTLDAKRFWVVARNDEEREHVFSLGANFAYAQPLGGSEEADPNLFDEEFVPIYERYRAGGSTTVRGFAFGGAGPHGQGDPRFEFRNSERGNTRRRDLRLAETAVSVLDNDGDPIGGDVLLAASAEYQFPVYEDVLRGVLFFDTGMVRDGFGSSHGLEESDVADLRRRLAAGAVRDRRLARRLSDFDDGPAFLSDMRMSVGFGFRIRVPIFGQQPIALDFGFPIKDQDGDDRQLVSFSIARDF